MTTPTPTVRKRRRKTFKQERVCSVCSQAFKKAEHLARHFRSHTKEKPFQCPVCGRTYTRQDTLLRHSRSHQTGDQEGGCITISDENTPNPLHAGGGCADVSKKHIEERHPSSICPETATMHNFDRLSNEIPSPPLTKSSSVVPTEESGLDSFNWGLAVDPTWPSWFIGDDFDLDAVNLDVLHTSNQSMSDGPNYNILLGTTADRALDLEENLMDVHSSVQSQWHTYHEMTSSGNATPTSSQRPLPLDESYRRRLADNLRQNVQHGILPSTPFLKLCLQAYFTRFHPVFPIIHVASFRPSTRNSMLLLSMCSIGSLFLGSPRAVAHGISIFEQLNKAILASWERNLSPQNPRCLTALQASIIGQTFGFLIGRSKDLAGIEIFHGSVIAWARMSNLFKEKDLALNLPQIDDYHSSNETLLRTWKQWILMEERKRIVLSLYIHDAELAKLRHHEPLMRHSVDRLPRLAPSKLFEASTAEQWKSLAQELLVADRDSCSPSTITTGLHIRADNIPPAAGFGSNFEQCAILNSIGASFMRGIRDLEAAEVCSKLLMAWYESNRAFLAQSSIHDRAGLMILWHSIFLSLHADFDELERACGRDGDAESHDAFEYCQKWANSVDEQRCLLHATQIQTHFESLSLGTEPPIHIPICLYRCGIVWFCFSKFSTHKATMWYGQGVSFPELSLLGVDLTGDAITSALLEASGIMQADISSFNGTFRIIDLLQRVGRWKIAQNFAATLLALLEKTHNIF